MEGVIFVGLQIYSLPYNSKISKKKYLTVMMTEALSWTESDEGQISP